MVLRRNPDGPPPPSYDPSYYPQPSYDGFEVIPPSHTIPNDNATGSYPAHSPPAPEPSYNTPLSEPQYSLPGASSDFYNAHQAPALPPQSFIDLVPAPAAVPEPAYHETRHDPSPQYVDPRPGPPTLYDASTIPAPVELPPFPGDLNMQAAPPAMRADGPGGPEEQDRGLMGAVAGGVAGAYAGHKVHHGFLGGLSGAYLGHKLEDRIKEQRKKSKSPSPGPPGGWAHAGGHHVPPALGSVPPVMGNFSASSRSVTLDGDYDLIASCRRCDGSERLSSISLNHVLTNSDGRFVWMKPTDPHPGNFAASARSVRLGGVGGSELHAELRNCKGKWVRASVRLDERISNVDGDLKLL